MSNFDAFEVSHDCTPLASHLYSIVKNVTFAPTHRISVEKDGKGGHTSTSSTILIFLMQIIEIQRFEHVEK